VRHDALHNGEKILTVAAELMSQRGSNVPLAEIAEAAGVGVGTFYRGYPDHTALLHALEQRADTLLYEVLGSPRQASCARSARGKGLVDSSDENGGLAHG
jgi:AcrR family transcriptional regulator